MTSHSRYADRFISPPLLDSLRPDMGNSPFTAHTLEVYAPYQQLDDAVKSKLLLLAKADRLNEFGRLKRAPNVWLVFRSNVLAHSQDKSKPQSQVTIESKAKWAKTGKQAQAEYKDLAKEKLRELLELFPDYQYLPMKAGEKERWRALGVERRKEFWFTSAVRIAKRMANPEGHWPGFLLFEDWEKDNGLSTVDSSSAPDNGTSSAAPSRVTPASPAPRRTQRSKQAPIRGSTEPTPSEIPPPRAQASHPYNDARAATSRPVEIIQANRPRAQKNSPPPKWLNEVLMDIGPQVPGGKRRRLVLCAFQPLERTIWVEEEVDNDLPEEFFQQLQKSDPLGVSDLILRNYTNPSIPDGVTERFQSIEEYHACMAHFEVSNDEECGGEEGPRLSPPWATGISPYSPDLQSPGYTPPELSPALGSNLGLFSHELVVPHSVAPPSRVSPPAPSTSPNSESSLGITLHPPSPSVMTLHNSHPLAPDSTAGAGGFFMSPEMATELEAANRPPQGVAQYEAEQAAIGQQGVGQQASDRTIDYQAMGQNITNYEVIGHQTMGAQAVNRSFQNTYTAPELSRALNQSQVPPVQHTSQPQQRSQFQNQHELQSQAQSYAQFQFQPAFQPQRSETYTGPESTQSDNLDDWLIPSVLNQSADLTQTQGWDAYSNMHGASQ